MPRRRERGLDRRLPASVGAPWKDVKLDSTARDILAECSVSTEAVAKILFPEVFWRPFGENQRGICALLDDDKAKQVVIIAHRESGKSKLAQLAYAARNILFGLRHFIVPISQSGRLAERNSENLKAELQTNERVLSLFGPIESSEFSQEMWVSANGVAVMPRGQQQQVRGITYRHWRPELVILDDVEDREDLASPVQRQKVRDWFFHDVLNAAARSNPLRKIVVLANMQHEDSLAVRLLRLKDWTSGVFPLCDGQLASRWPSYMSDDAVRSLYDEFERAGQLASFYSEYLCVLQGAGGFKEDLFRRYRESDLPPRERAEMETIVIMDPSRSSLETACETGIVAIGMMRATGRLYVREARAGHWTPSQQIDNALDVCRKWDARVLAVEVTGLNEYITYPLENAIRTRALGIRLMPLHSQAQKEERVRALLPLYRDGWIYHNQAETAGLEAQLLGFPRSAKWDLMDCLAHVVGILGTGGRYLGGRGDPSKMSSAQADAEVDRFLTAMHGGGTEGGIEPQWRAAARRTEAEWTEALDEAGWRTMDEEAEEAASILAGRY